MYGDRVPSTQALGRRATIRPVTRRLAPAPPVCCLPLLLIDDSGSEFENSEPGGL